MLDLGAVGGRLREERKRLGLTQAELALRVGVSRAAIVTYESGRTPPDVSFMDRVKGLGVRTSYVLSGLTEVESAAEALDWDIARALMNKIVRYARVNNIDLEPDQLVDLMQILYPTAARNRTIDDRAVEIAVRLAA
jgi:transcriptional regulator with XRE-family HTH domain